MTVITCVPNFPRGKVFSGYRNRLWQTEVMDGIRVIRVWTYITANEGFLKRIVDYVSFMLAATLASFFVRKVDLVIGTSPQFFTACAAFAVGSIKRLPWVFELRDIWPESIKAVGAMKNALAIRWLEQLEMFLYWRASKIVAVTHMFKEILVRRGIDKNKIDVVTNGVDLQHFAPQERDARLVTSLGLGNCFTAGYIGTHGLAHGLDTLLEAAQLLEQIPSADNVRILLLGDGGKKVELMEKARAMGLKNVIFLDTVPKGQVARYWSLLDVSIIHLKKTELFGSVIPSKLFECMGMGIPVLHGVAGESAEIVKREQVGVTFEPENARQLVEELLILRGDRQRYLTLRNNGLLAAKHYDRRHLAETMLGLLGNLVAK